MAEGSINTTPTLKAPFPAFGGKSLVADAVWERLGDVRNYVEPFCFSAAVLLRRPANIRLKLKRSTIEITSLQISGGQLSATPRVLHIGLIGRVETDLHSRHQWLVGSTEARSKLLEVAEDPEFYDVKIAGWWCWGACCWIGTGWCDEQESEDCSLPIRTGKIKRPVIGGGGLGKGINADHRPQLADAFSRGRGVNGNDAASTCEQRRKWLTGWMLRLADRLRPVRVCAGHWSRVCDSTSTMDRLGTTGVLLDTTNGIFLDPPYRLSLADAKRIDTHTYTPTIDAKTSTLFAMRFKHGA